MIAAAMPGQKRSHTPAAASVPRWAA